MLNFKHYYKGILGLEYATGYRKAFTYFKHRTNFRTDLYEISFG